jgi:Domain of unknown function (DUF4290)
MNDTLPFKFSYNTAQSELIMPEYGRNVQDLVMHCKAIEDPVYRQAFAEEVINLMQIMTPYNKNIDEHRRKLWHHFFRIAGYDIDIQSPYGNITAEEDRLKPQRIIYPTGTDKFRHYGNYVNTLIKKAMEMEPGPKRDEFSHIIGNYMKMAFKNWNKEHYVSDELIKNDLLRISNGELAVDESIQFHNVPNAPVKNQKRVFKGGMNKQKYQNKKGGGGGGNFNRNKRRV